MTDLWHCREEILDPGAIIQPGRWGSIVRSQGEAHPFFYREQLLELWRVARSSAPVSRLACAFAFEQELDARDFCPQHHHLYRVEPVDESAPTMRCDMLWLTWLGEPGTVFSQTAVRLAGYWGGKATSDIASHAHTTWERLLASPLRVLSRLPAKSGPR